MQASSALSVTGFLNEGDTVCPGRSHMLPEKADNAHFANKSCYIAFVFIIPAVAEADFVFWFGCRQVVLLCTEGTLVRILLSNAAGTS